MMLNVNNILNYLVTLIFNWILEVPFKAFTFIQF